MNFKLYTETQNAKDILINLIKGKVSKSLLQNVINDVPKLSLPEQEELLNILDKLIDDNQVHYNGPKKERDAADNWGEFVWGPAYDYAFKTKHWIDTLYFARLRKSIEDDEKRPPVTAVPYTHDTNFAYHITNIAFLNRIKQIGLTPRDPAEETGFKTNKAVFFFAAPEETIHLAKGILDDGAWKGAALLKINIQGLPLFKRSSGSATGSGEEFYTNKRVLPNRIVGITIYNEL